MHLPQSLKCQSTIIFALCNVLMYLIKKKNDTDKKVKFLSFKDYQTHVRKNLRNHVYFSFVYYMKSIIKHLIYVAKYMTLVQDILKTC